MLEAVRGDGCALQFASDELRADPEERVFFAEGGRRVVRWWCFFVWVRPWEVMVRFICFFVGGWVGGFMQPRCWFISVY